MQSNLGSGTGGWRRGSRIFVRLEIKVLGFRFDVEKRTRIKTNDGVTLLVFIKDNQVERYFETPRGNIDFTSVTPTCIDRENAHLKLESNSNWTRAVHSGKRE